MKYWLSLAASAGLLLALSACGNMFGPKSQGGDGTNTQGDGNTPPAPVIDLQIQPPKFPGS